ncbi:MAG TPA: hypothetical protein VHD36_03960 [Pirellulales bacterium]|nr:hypothetical protein [Pirellulales bacterium]
MRRTSIAIGLVLMAACASWAQAQVVGPARRAAAAAGDAVGAPGVGARIENREAHRAAVRADVNPDAAARQDARINNADRWRYVNHRNQWWYYTPQNSWMYYRNNHWTAYDPATYSNPRYTTGYRGNRFYNRRNYVPSQNVAPMGPAAQNGANLGADIGNTAAGPAGANRGAAIGGAVGNTIDAARGTAPAPVPTPAPNPALVNPTIPPNAQPGQPP